MQELDVRTIIFDEGGGVTDPNGHDFARVYSGKSSFGVTISMYGLEIKQASDGEYFIDLNNYVPDATSNVFTAKFDGYNFRLNSFWHYFNLGLDQPADGIVHIGKEDDHVLGYNGEYIYGGIGEYMRRNAGGHYVRFQYTFNEDDENRTYYDISVAEGEPPKDEDYNNPPIAAAPVSIQIDVMEGNSAEDKIICDVKNGHYIDKYGNELTENSIANYSRGEYGKLGFVADGNSRLIVRVKSNKPGYASFLLSEADGIRLESLTDRSSISNGDSIQASQISEGYQASAVLVASESFTASKEFPSDTFKLTVIFIAEDEDIQEGKYYNGKMITDNGNVYGRYDIESFRYVIADTKTVELKLEAAPVILIPGKVNAHGWFLTSWGDANHTFCRNNNSGIWRELLNIGFKKEHITLFDYNSTKSVKDNTSSLYDCLQNMFETYAKEGIVCTKADIVAHGLGGLLVRQFLDESNKSDNSNWSPISYRQGMIHKVVNITVPHRGTPLANVILGDMSVINSDLSLGKDRLAYRIIKYLPAFCSEFLATPAQWKDLAVGSDVVSLPFPANVPMHFIYGDVTHSLDEVEKVKDGLLLVMNLASLVKTLKDLPGKIRELEEAAAPLEKIFTRAILENGILDEATFKEVSKLLNRNNMLRLQELMKAVKEYAQTGMAFAEMISNSPTFTGLMQIGGIALGGVAGLVTTPLDLYFVIQRLIFSGQAHDTFVPKSSAIAAFPEYSTGFPITPSIFDLWHFKHGEICHQTGVAEFVGYLLKAAPMSDFAVLTESVQLPRTNALPATVKTDSTVNSDSDIDFENFRVKNFDLSIRKSTRENFGDGMTALKFIANASTLTSNDAKLVIQKDGLDRIFPMFTHDGYTFEAIIVFKSGDEGALTAYCYAPSDKGKLYVSDTVEFSYLDTFADEEPDSTPPQINISELPCAVIGQSYAAKLTTSGTYPITWTLTGRLPAGLTLSESGLISGIPTKAGKSTFTAKATNDYGHDSQKFTLQVYEPVSISTAGLKDATIGKNYSATFKAKGTRQITWSAEGLPDGLTINAKTGRISGRPTTYGIYNAKITATNGAGSLTKNFELTVKGIPPKIAGNLARAELNMNYSSGLRLTAGSSPVVWSVEGALPEGLTLDSETGIISGTPTSYAKSGYKLTITATNDAGSKSKKITLNVKGKAPKITTKLTDAEAGKTYSATLTATGSQPIIWSAGDIPSWLAIDGDTIIGTPTEEGRFRFTIYASNPVKTVSKVFTLRVKASTTEKNTVPEIYTRSESSNSVTAQALTENLHMPANISSGIPEGYIIAAEIGEVSCDVPGMYDFEVVLGDEIPEGAELAYSANSESPSDDDSIAEFYDEAGKEISSVPENRRIILSIWLNEGVRYSPAVLVRK